MLRRTSPCLSTADLLLPQTVVGISPEIVAAILKRADPDTSITAKDVSNRSDAERREELAKDTPTDVLLTKLTGNKFFYKVEVDPDTSRLRYLFWSHPSIKNFYGWNSNVLILDCT